MRQPTRTPTIRQRTRTKRTRSIGISAHRAEPMMAVLAGFNANGHPVVDLGDGEPDGLVQARTLIALGHDHLGHEVFVQFDRGSRERPVIMGVPLSPQESLPMTAESEHPVTASLDDETVVLNAQREIVLRVGKASIRLTEDGMIILNGTYVVSRSSGSNRIVGASVEIN